jgi:hypothetical protein
MIFSKLFTVHFNWPVAKRNQKKMLDIFLESHAPLHSSLLTRLGNWPDALKMQDTQCRADDVVGQSPHPIVQDRRTFATSVVFLQPADPGWRFF